jgi:hypothetical protein
MKHLKTMIGYGTKFFAQYPAVLSGYIIYSYLFVSMVRLFIKARYYGATLSDAYDIFSALPFMWFLAVSLVKVIEYRSKLFDSETRRMNSEKELQTKITQLTTMHEVVKGLQHQVNNPLAIIALSIGQTKRSVGNNPTAMMRIESIEHAANQISFALQKFSEAEQYESEHVDEVVGTIASIPLEHLQSGPLKMKKT